MGEKKKVFGQSLNASVLQIWFPAHWAVRVATRIRALGGTVPEFKAEHASTNVPNVRCGIKLPDQSLNVEHLLPSFCTVYRGILRGVFRQQAGGAWFLCKTVKIHITVIMPQSSEPHHWFAAVARREGSWPMESASAATTCLATNFLPRAETSAVPSPMVQARTELEGWKEMALSRDSHN